MPKLSDARLRLLDKRPVLIDARPRLLDARPYLLGARLRFLGDSSCLFDKIPRRMYASISYLDKR